MNRNILHNDHLIEQNSRSGSKIPITVVEAVYRDPEDQTTILLRETAVISGHNIPSDQLEQIKKILRSQLKIKFDEGIRNGTIESIRRSKQIEV